MDDKEKLLNMLNNALKDLGALQLKAQEETTRKRVYGKSSRPNVLRAHYDSHHMNAGIEVPESPVLKTVCWNCGATVILSAAEYVIIPTHGSVTARLEWVCRRPCQLENGWERYEVK